MSPEFEAGQMFEAVYPFARDTYTRYDGDEETGPTSTEVATWKPGVRAEHDGAGDTMSVADALGQIVLTVVSVHKPGKYPTRVFFTRKWRDPDGRVFGKGACRMTTANAFRTLTQGFRVPYVLKGCACLACKWPDLDHRMRSELEARHADSQVTKESPPHARA